MSFFDETGDRLTPGHSKKNGKRLRYYISRRLVTDRSQKHPDAWRLPAEQLEGLITDLITAHLKQQEIAVRLMAPDQIEVIADKGYYKGEEILACEKAGIAAVVPQPETSNAGARGQFDKADFAYEAENDVHICPAGEQLIDRFTGPQDGKAIRVYWSSNCAGCVIKDKCTNGKQRRIRRWEYEDVLERAQQRLDKDPTQLALRSITVEHSYGTIKSWMGATHFKMRRLKNVATEMALHVLAYKMTPVMKIMGIPAMVAAMTA